MNIQSTLGKFAPIAAIIALLVPLAGCAAPIQDTRSQTNIALSQEVHKNFSMKKLEANLALADDNIEIFAYAFGLQ